ncbi:class I SAM-dependent DNA methyltransferase [Micrococcus terreus]|uniref:class I SAM-dependent DNA methyltransferase n=1 Tax=Micrococcus terreus TaxID=574650 RepID=UPI0021A6BC79|nr:DNA methyltransferase [Micrococcus terreus]MCT2089733.1 class I SAM-dependent DNA methyltransferase [Micrococcus terreus]
MQTKPLSWSEIRKNATAFVKEWSGETYEKGEAQSFWTELLAVYGVRRRAVARFEAQAKRINGGTGFIDLFWPGMLIAEQKSAGKDLVAAEDQAMQYLNSVTEAEQPRYVITCDFATFRLRDLEAPPGEDPVVTFALEDLPAEAERFGFMAGYHKRAFGSEQQAEASIKAAQIMADLYIELEKSGYDEHESSVFLVRTLFALFADDSGLWERDLFLEYVETRTSPDGSDLGAQLSVLFQTLNRPEDKRLKNADELLLRFPYVNGSVFGEPISIPYFDRAMRDKLLAACHFNWGTISPAIFGSLFQAVKSKAARRELGEHYTTEENILKLIGPLFLDDLRQQFIDNQHKLPGLRKLLQDMGELRFLDPACGCGNFLIVAYRELRALELEVLVRIQELDRRAQQTALVMDEDDLVRVRMNHFYGIELEEWPATIARTAMFLVDHQANQDMSLKIGQSPGQLPLTESAQITVGNALRTGWNDVLPASNKVIVMGNPPFLGHVSRSEEQAEDLKAAWNTPKPGRLDYVTGWYAKSVHYFQGCDGGRWGFVSTNSITQGDQPARVFPAVFGGGWRIRFAHRTFSWSSEAPDAAAVHCVIIGFDRDVASAARLFSYIKAKGEPTESPARTINAYLVDGPNILVPGRSRRLSPDLPEVDYGSLPADGGNLIVERDEYAEVAADPVMKKYLRRFVGARELLRGENRWVLWLVDLDPSDVQKSQALRKRLEGVRRMRSESTLKSTRDKASTPHLFYFNGHPEEQYVCLPSTVSENRPFFTAALLDKDVIASNATSTAVDPDGFAFAVASSSMFITWQKTVGGRLKSDIRFAKKTTWNTLPLPPVDEDLRQQIIEAGRGVLDARGLRPERSLADHYNPLTMDPDLLRAHRALDRVVDKAFGCKIADPTEQDRQETLFARYADLTSAGQLDLKTETSRRRRSTAS